MTTQNTRTERMKLLKAQIEYHNNLYYNQDNPEISDAAYDALVRELRELEGNSPTLDSPTQKIGGIAQSTFKKTLHTIPLLSLKDVFDVSEVKNWIASIPDNISKKKFVVEEKVDGLSIAITYVNGIFTSAATRGDGQIGEDVTENARMIANIPKKISQLRFENEVIVRAEVIMPTATFDEVNKQLELEGKPLFKNPRNAAAGSLRTKDASITEKRGLQAIAFQILYEKNAAFLRNSQSKDIQYLSDFGFDIVSCKECDNIDDIVFAIEEIGNARKKSDYWIDGAVVKCNDIALQNQLGNTSKYPRWAVAFKYPPEQKETIVREIITQTGRTGVITPVAVFDPVLLCGTSVSRATLHNQQFMDNILGGVAVGDTILVHKSGEIIPEVLKVFHEKRPSDANHYLPCLRF